MTVVADSPQTAVSIPRPLADFGGRAPSAPDWFRRALAQRPEPHFVTVDGTAIETLTWGREGAPGLMLLHGLGGHADWWSFIAPFFAETHRVTALSWSGMGRSGWRPRYDYATYGREIGAVAEACGLAASGRAPVVIGHSFGGGPLIHAAAQTPEHIGGVILLDCYFKLADDSLGGRSDARHRLYPSQAEALMRFRFSPPQTCSNLFVADYIARRSLCETDGGWTWRFDPALRAKLEMERLEPHLARLSRPVALMAGDRSSLVTESFRAAIAPLIDRALPWILIPDADHHVMIDQPLALVAALRGLLSAWPEGAGHSSPPL